MVGKQTTAGQWTALASKLRAKASGTHASMVAQSAASGARYIFIARQANRTFAERGIDEKHWKYAQSK